MDAGQGVDQLELGGVGVLEFVHHDIAIAGAAGLQRLGMLAEQAQRQQYQVIEVHRVAGAQGRFIVRADVLGHGAHTRVAENRASPAGVLAPAQYGQHRRRVGLLSLGRNPGQDFPDRAEGVGLVEDDEIALVSEPFDVLAQDARAEGVEGAEGEARVGGRAWRWGGFCGAQSAGNQLADPLLHLAGRLVGERDAQDVARGNAPLEQIRDAIGDDARLARASPGQDEDRAMEGLDGLPLLRIERGQVQHGAGPKLGERSSCTEEGPSSRRLSLAARIPARQVFPSRRDA